MKNKFKFLLLLSVILTLNSTRVLATDTDTGDTQTMENTQDETGPPEEKVGEEDDVSTEPEDVPATQANEVNEANATNPSKQVKKNSDCLYLSDISYLGSQSFASGSHEIHLDENESNDLLTLKVDGSAKSFIKGLCAWATSEIVYDLKDYSGYDYFTATLGVDISEQNDYFNTGVMFYIYTSTDGTTWDKQYQSAGMTAENNAVDVKVNLSGARYLKLVADDNSDAWWAEWYDEAIYADAKLIKEGYTEDTTAIDFIKTVAEYDKLIKDNGSYDTNQYELTLLQREFVKNAGYDILQALAKYKAEYKDTLQWLMNDTETLRLYLVAGKPEGSYLNSVKVLSTLYTKYKDTDLANTNKTKYNTAYKDLYRTMILALSLTESGNVYFWMDGKCHSDAVTRYEIYKKLHLHEGQSEELIENKNFESLTVEEMRWVMNTIIDDEEILWLNNWVRTKGGGNISPYNYITYTFDYNYALNDYYSEENRAKWNDKYLLSDYNVSYGKGHQKLWIVFEQGSVCGGLSKTGSCIWGAYKGLPNTCVSQPDHCAYTYYTVTDSGEVKWELGNNVSGWGKSGKTEHLNTRTMNDWGSGSYTSGWNANYILLAQAAQNEYEKYEAAEKILMLADVYKDNSKKLEEIYRKALSEETINFDAWLGLIEVYEKDHSKTEEDYFKLAQDIVKNLTYYPYPMNDLLKLIKPHLTSVGYDAAYTKLLTDALETAKKATANESIQYEAVNQVATELLGNTDSTIASFSFDGKNAGKLILSSRYDGTDVQWEYTLDGGIDETANWVQSDKHELQLTDKELAQITADKDIRIHIVGTNYTQENIFIIDIQESKGLPVMLYANDLENRLICATDSMQWKYITQTRSAKSSNGWTYFKDEKPDLTGNKSILVRAGATGTYLAETEETVEQRADEHTFTFTEDKQPDTQTYVSIDNLDTENISVSSAQKGDDAINALDGNINTIWHTLHNGNDKDKWFVIKLKEPIYLSAFQYVPRQDGPNGRAKKATIYTSMDGENWTKAGEGTNWENNAEAKTIALAESVKTQYVKFVVNENYGPGGSFASAAMLNLFEDLTKKATPTAKIAYNITESTTDSVTAKLVDPSTEITITNNDGKDTYVFTENGEFTFEFVDKYGNKGTAVAKVDWIVTDSGNDEQTPDDDINKPSVKPTTPSTDSDKSDEETNTSGNSGNTSKDESTNSSAGSSSSSSSKKDNKKTNPVIKVPKRNSATSKKTTGQSSTKKPNTSTGNGKTDSNGTTKDTETIDDTKTEDSLINESANNESSADSETSAASAETTSEETLLDRLKKQPIPLIAGLLILILIVSIFLIRRRKKRKLLAENETPPTDTPPTGTVAEDAPLTESSSSEAAYYADDYYTDNYLPDGYFDNYPPVDYPSDEYFPDDYYSDNYPQ